MFIQSIVWIAVPCLPVKPWQITRVFLSTHTLAVDDMRAAPVRRGEEDVRPIFWKNRDSSSRGGRALGRATHRSPAPLGR